MVSHIQDPSEQGKEAFTEKKRRLIGREKEREKQDHRKEAVCASGAGHA